MTARDLNLINLTAILLSLAMVIAPHAVHLPTWIPALVAVVLLARFYFGWQHRKLPNKWLLIAVALACTAGIGLSYRTLYGRDVGVAILTVLMALKVMEMSRPRDTMTVVLLAYFLVVTNFFYSQSIPTALYMLLVVWVITATMIGLQHQAGRPKLGLVLRHAATIILQGVPIMLALFLLFPRVQGPLWGLPQINFSAKSGLSESMAPGDVSSLSLSDEVAFRVLFENQPKQPSQLYWRGPVLWNYDGRTWRPGLNLTAPGPAVEALGPPLRYTVTMEAHDRYWMFAVDLPLVVPQGAYLTTDFQLLSRRIVRERLRYEMQSAPQYRIGVDESPGTLRLARRLPPEVSPRARALAAQWQAQAGSDRDIVSRALGLFREQPFTYTLDPPKLDADPVDQFLFDTRSGFCEHYASAFTFLMRAAGIPARVVTGYLGGEVNPVDGYVVVRQSDAHAWSEVWLPGEGWVREDPTAAVSPLRIERGLAAAVPEIERPLLARNSFDWLKQARFAWDAVANTWNQWVLGYNPDRQMRFLAQFGLADVTWQNMVIILTAVSGIIILTLSLVLLFRINAQRPDPVQRAYLSYCDAMAKRGAARKPSEGPRDFAARVSMQFPEFRETAQKISALYVSLRYGGGDKLGKLQALRDAVRTLS
jgi:protein-glutamine gamma-glutamyltransferase